MPLLVTHKEKGLTYQTHNAFPDGYFLLSNIFFLFSLEVGSIEGLAYDSVYQELYWTSFTNSSISRIQVDVEGASPQKIIQLGTADHPRAIVINTCEMYVSLF